MRATSLFFVLFSLCLAACGADDAPGVFFDAAFDTSADSVSEDTDGEDVGDSDATLDASEDANEDANEDVADDTTDDTGEPDAETDSEDDADEDTAPDVVPDVTGPDETPPSATGVSPESGEELNVVRNITVFFDESIDTAELALGGTLGAESGDIIWSETNVPDDTLTIRPDGLWTIADGATLDVSVADLSGNDAPLLMLSYDVRCGSTGDCPSPQRCVEGLCVLTPCDEPADCGGFDGCVEGFCGPCGSNDDCEATEECSRTQCLPLPT